MTRKKVLLTCVTKNRKIQTLGRRKETCNRSGNKWEQREENGRERNEIGGNGMGGKRRTGECQRKEWERRWDKNGIRWK